MTPEDLAMMNNQRRGLWMNSNAQLMCRADPKNETRKKHRAAASLEFGAAYDFARKERGYVSITQLKSNASIGARRTVLSFRVVPAHGRIRGTTNPCDAVIDSRLELAL